MKKTRSTAAHSETENVLPGRRSFGKRAGALLGLSALLVWSGSLRAGTIYVPNASFESPQTTLADPRIDFWEKIPPFADGSWDLQTGVFTNSPPGDPSRIENCDGNQAAFLFANPGVGLVQDFNSTDWSGSAPTHGFDARFEIGKTYQLTVGVLVGEVFPMAEGATLESSLYYRDAASNRVTVAATTITNLATRFNNATNLIDFQVQTAPVKSIDPWAGQHIGIAMMSTVTNSAGGYWDLDNIRLTQAIYVPNASFESPQTTLADPRIDFWEKIPPFADGSWDLQTGVFTNSPPGDPSRIENCDGNQAAFLFANPGVGLVQDFNSTDWSGSAPTHGFDARFEIGKTYQLTVGVLVGEVFPMAEGATLELSLYYRDAASNRVTVAATTITNLATRFNNATNLIDFQVQTAPVKSIDPWAGQHIGIAMMSTVTNSAGGYWDLDNVRLTETLAPTLVGPTAASGTFSFTLRSEPGLKFQVLAGGDPALPVSGWSNLGTLTNVTGSVSFVETITNINRRFYQVRQTP